MLMYTEGFNRMPVRQVKMTPVLKLDDIGLASEREMRLSYSTKFVFIYIYLRAPTVGRLAYSADVSSDECQHICKRFYVDIAYIIT